MRAGPANRRRKVVLAATSLAGLVLAVAGLMPVASGVDSPPARLVLDLPAWLGIPFVILMGLATLFIFFLLASGLPRQKRAARRPAAMAPAVVLLMVLALSGGLRNHLGIDFDALLRSLVEKTGSAELPGSPAADSAPPVPSEVASDIAETSLLALALMAFGVLAWLYLGLLPPRGRESALPLAASELPSELQAAVEESLDELRHLTDARLAIIRCYSRFERVLAGADVRRAPSETVLEFMARALAHPGVKLPRAAARELAGLFEIARFSRHELGPSHRERAWQALMSVKAALETETVDAARA